MEDRSALKQLIDRDEFNFNDFIGEKTEGLVFDKRTLDNIYTLFKQFNIKYVDYPISSGKESLVFKVEGAKKGIVMKIFKTSTLRFQHINDYIDGDPRFANQRKSRGTLIYVWARKEYANLLECRKFRVRVPEPFAVVNNIILMSYIGERRTPAKKLKDIEESQLQGYFNSAMIEYGKMVEKAKLIHADMSEYNVLCYRKRSYIIDMGQAVSYKHPKAKEFFTRDMVNMKSFAKRNELSLDEIVLPKFPGDTNE
ncbi:MAG: serine protein kinase RIO [Cuniculiplasma sp.]